MSQRNKKILKKELLAASLIALMGIASKKAEAKEAAAPEPRVEVSATPTATYETENTIDFPTDDGYREEHYVYDRRLSKGLSIKYSGAYVNWETGEVLLKAVSRYDEDSHYSSIKRCRESQELRTGPYDCSGDKQIRREQIRNGEYNKRVIVHDVIKGINKLIRSRRGR